MIITPKKKPFKRLKYTNMIKCYRLRKDKNYIVIKLLKLLVERKGHS